jgi:serine/threonine protein kinase/cytochrome c-type biogenesis protein CcmH/NrfG
MKAQSCPQCRGEVGEDLHACPSCGSDLRPTAIAEEDTRTLKDSGARDRLDLLPGQTLAGRFTIIERIGEGGMGVVYKAIDNALGGTVALKLILPELSGRRSLVERFRREVRLTRQITHPNICRVHDIGDSAGVLYLSMEWIEGETLRQLLRKTGVLKEGRALEIAGKIARGLRAAHEVHVIHRDLKPANVMVDRGGNIRLVDFGLAVEPGSGRLTGSGGVLGTPLYMSPEQQRGEKLDARTDLYSLGLILRDMLTGIPAQSGVKVNPLIEPVIDRLLALNREDRYASAREVQQALDELQGNPAISAASTVPPLSTPSPGSRRRFRWLAAGAAGVLAVAAVATYILSIIFNGEPALDPDARAFYDRGMHYLREESESVKSLGDAITHFHQAENHDPDSALVMARLAEANWYLFHKTTTTVARAEAERYVAKARAIDPSLPETRFARALGFLEDSKYEAAKAELEQTVAARPRDAIALAYLGLAHQNLGDYASGLAALDRAKELEPGSFRVQVYRGLFYQHFGEHDEASSCYRKAIELKSDSTMAWTNLGAAQLHTGRSEEAIVSYRRSIEIEDTADARTNLGTAYYLLGRFGEALEHYRLATDFAPPQAVRWRNLGDAYEALERAAEARQAYARAVDLARDRVERDRLNPHARRRLALYCAKARDTECALENAAMLIELQPDSAQTALTHAVIFCTLGRDAESLGWLKQAVDLGASEAEIRGSPELSRLEDLPRYREILDLAG